jgi:DNA invertase Pin-like site-specific DNA recombinase
MKAAIYARVSTIDKGQDPELQLRPMREYCERMSMLWDEYVDYASGIKESRPQLDKLMAKLKLREYDILIVWKLDRLARSLKQLIDIVYGELRPRNIDFKVLTQDIDTNTPTGTLLFSFLGALAVFEHDLHSERITEGMKLAKEKGVKLGRKPVDVNLPRLIYLYHENKEAVRPTVRAYNAGLPPDKQLNPGTAYGYLKGVGK